MSLTDWQSLFDGKIDTLLREQSRQGEALVSVIQRLEEHSNTLYGNGRPGVVERTKDNENGLTNVRGGFVDLITICRDRHRPPGPWSRIWPTVVSSVLAAVILAVLVFALGLWKSTPAASASANTNTNHAPTAQKGP